MRTFVGDDEFVQPKRNETAPRSECRFTSKNALTQPRLLEMDVKPASVPVADFSSMCQLLVGRQSYRNSSARFRYASKLTSPVPNKTTHSGPATGSSVPPPDYVNLPFV